MSDCPAITYREVAPSDLGAIAAMYTHHWCNEVPDPADKMLAARLCVLVALRRSPLSVVAVQDGTLVGVCLGCVVADGTAPVDLRWQQAYDEALELASERARAAYPALVELLFGDLHETEVADEFIATGNPYAEAELNLFMVEPHLKGAGVGREMLRRMCDLFRAAGARRFFLMTDTDSNYAYYERRGMQLLLDRDDDRMSWGVLMYGSDL